MDLASSSSRRWLVYALGGGMGHLNRAVALSRAAVRDSGQGKLMMPPEIVLLTNSPFAETLPISDELGEGYRVLKISSTLSRDKTAAEVTKLIQSERFDTFVVDTFPRGLGGELATILPELDCRKILVHRDLNPKYCGQYKLKEFVQHYDRLLVPGEAAPLDDLTHAVRTDPWLIRDQHELLNAADARQMLRVESDALPVVAVIGCGRTNEIEQMRSLATKLSSEFASIANIRFATLGQLADDKTCQKPPSDAITLRFWPFFQAIRGVSIIVGGGGYNLVHEARAAKTKLIGLSWPRLYDRQQRRLNVSERVVDLQQAFQQVATAIKSHSKASRNPPLRFRNGVHQAIKLINAAEA
jgi:hypothetical protein